LDIFYVIISRRQFISGSYIFDIITRWFLDFSGQRGCHQHYPPGTQENYNNFPSRNLMMEKGKESEFLEGRGLEILRIYEGQGSGNPSDL
jgi:hypothetical protein